MHSYMNPYSKAHHSLPLPLVLVAKIAEAAPVRLSARQCFDGSYAMRTLSRA